MNIYFAGGEDISYPTFGSYVVNTTASRFRSGWARCALRAALNTPTGGAHSTAFSAQTSAWFSFQIYLESPVNAAQMFAGLGLAGTNNSLGVGSDTTTAAKVAIFKYDGTTRTQLAAETGTSWTTSTMFRIDMQVISYGASATVNVYVNGVLTVSFTGDVTVSGMTNFDSVYLPPNPFNVTSPSYSEIYVTDTDSRGFLGLQTEALTGAGTTNSFTNNTFTNINGISFSDANPTFTNTVAQDQQYTITTPTPATYTVAGVVITARMAASAGSTPTQIKLGYRSGVSVGFGTGAGKTLTTGYVTYTQTDVLNPVTGVAFTQSELAALQLDMQSA
jgi:hypothetical protein